MDNYEINILRRDGNWKKVKPDDQMIDTLENNEEAKKQSSNLQNKISEDSFLYYLEQINHIISKLEFLENEKNRLKNKLKAYEQEFITKKKKTEDIIKSISREKEMVDKTISVIKNLKNF